MISIGKGVYIAKTAVIIGNVTIGDNVSIFDGAVLRGDLDKITIGDNSNVQDNVTIHVDTGYPARIGKNVSIGHNAVVHGCTVDDDVVIGMSSVLMNGSHVSSGSVVGAGAVVTQGFSCDENSLILGVPARVVKTDRTLSGYARANADEYLNLKNMYMENKIEKYYQG